MKKMKIGKRILDVMDQDDFIRRSILNPQISKDLADDTAVVSGDTVYPVNTKFTRDMVNVYDAGPVLVYSNPEDVNHDEL